MVFSPLPWDVSHHINHSLSFFVYAFSCSTAVSHSQPSKLDDDSDKPLFPFCLRLLAGDQYEAIQENTPYIDRLKKHKGKEQSAFRSLCDVFGEEKFSSTWLIPAPPTKELRRQFQQQITETIEVLLYVEESCLQAEQLGSSSNNE